VFLAFALDAKGIQGFTNSAPWADQRLVIQSRDGGSFSFSICSATWAFHFFKNSFLSACRFFGSVVGFPDGIIFNVEIHASLQANFNVGR
jgi:hypothetical protein